MRRRFQKETGLQIRNLFMVEFKKQRCIYKRKIIETKRKSFKEYLENVTTSNIFGPSYKIVRDYKMNNNILVGIRRNDGIYTENYNEATKEIVSYHFGYDETDNIDFINNNNDGDYNKLITKTGIHMVINEIKTKKVMVHDCINGEIIKSLYNSTLMKQLCFNEIL